MGLDTQSCEKIASLQEHVGTHLDDALAQFYEKLLTIPDVAHYFENKTLLTSAKIATSGPLARHCGGELNADYFKRSNVIGEVHARIGLEPRWYIGGYALIVETLIKNVVGDFVAQNMDGKGGLLGKNIQQKKFIPKALIWLMRWRRWSRL